MSVPVGMRGESKLEAQVKCEELVSHTVHITSNPNVFDPKYQAFINRVVDCAISIGQDVWEANGIKVSCAADYTIRHRLQERAVRSIDVLLYLMTIARKLFHLRGSKYRAWVEKARAAKGDSRLLMEGCDGWFADLTGTTVAELVEQRERNLDAALRSLLPYECVYWDKQYE
ncbi:MAG: hypothetical protein IKG22_01830 [Atopobiaceae bacterium]|nr:hypothetical protein [Atopobiaceae bacterium]